MEPWFHLIEETMEPWFHLIEEAMAPYIIILCSMGLQS